jgi:hypothetical protein
MEDKLSTEVGQFERVQESFHCRLLTVIHRSQECENEKIPKRSLFRISHFLASLARAIYATIEI